MSGLLTAAASLVEARAPGTPASVVVGLGLSCSLAGGILTWPGMESVSPALAGRFLSSIPAGKPHVYSLKNTFTEL